MILFEKFCFGIDKIFPEFSLLPETKRVYNDYDREHGYVYLVALTDYLIEKKGLDDNWSKDVIKFMDDFYNNPETDGKMKSFIAVGFMSIFLNSLMRDELDKFLTKEALNDYRKMKIIHPKHGSW